VRTYIINCLGSGRWSAERRDDHTVLQDTTSFGLREKMIADHSERPAPHAIGEDDLAEALRPPIDPAQDCPGAARHSARIHPNWAG
jgi:hypothetical protein